MLLQLLLQTLLTTCSLQAIVALMRQGIHNNGIATPALLLSLLLLLLFLLDTKLHEDNCRPQIVCNCCSHPTTITILKLLSLPVRPPQLPEHQLLNDQCATVVATAVVLPPSQTTPPSLQIPLLVFLAAKIQQKAGANQIRISSAFQKQMRSKMQRSSCC
jgi:hypothetical protein